MLFIRVYRCPWTVHNNIVMLTRCHVDRDVLACSYKVLSRLEESQQREESMEQKHFANIETLLGSSGGGPTGESPLLKTPPGLK